MKYVIVFFYTVTGTLLEKNYKLTQKELHLWPSDYNFKPKYMHIVFDNLESPSINICFYVIWTMTPLGVVKSNTLLKQNELFGRNRALLVVHDQRSRVLSPTARIPGEVIKKKTLCQINFLCLL